MKNNQEVEDKSKEQDKRSKQKCNNQNKKYK